MTHRATRYHDFSAGHRVVGHEHKCRHLHGHNYRIHFHCEAEQLDELGRVIDFGVIKLALCNWLEVHWDHKLILWEQDYIIEPLQEASSICHESLVIVPFNPTAENMAEYLVEKIGPSVLQDTGVMLVKVVIEETRKCSASYRRQK